MNVTCGCGQADDYPHEFPAPRTSTPSPIDPPGGDRAGTLATTERMADYGHPAVNFARIAGLWSEYLNTTVTSYDVGAMMILLKVARMADNGDQPVKADTIADIAGYADTLRLLNERRSGT